MADPQATSRSALKIPPAVAAQFAAVIGLIQGSESMNDEERQYWINILPVMTQEQVKNLEEILMNEKQQLAAIDAKYAAQAVGMPEPIDLQKVDDDRRHKRDERKKAEHSHEVEEVSTEADLLNKIQSL